MKTLFELNVRSTVDSVSGYTILTKSSLKAKALLFSPRYLFRPCTILNAFSLKWGKKVKTWKLFQDFRSWEQVLNVYVSLHKLFAIIKLSGKSLNTSILEIF